eukprot:907878-Pleurochrysis_carterae.AAC.1
MDVVTRAYVCVVCVRVWMYVCVRARAYVYGALLRACARACTREREWRLEREITKGSIQGWAVKGVSVDREEARRKHIGIGQLCTQGQRAQHMFSGILTKVFERRHFVNL